MADFQNKDNPFFQAWDTPFAAPPFDRIKTRHFIPAFRQGIRQQEAEIAVIAANPDPATFENTALALEKSGELLSCVVDVFNCVASTAATKGIDRISGALRPNLSRHESSIYQNDALFKRVEAVYKGRETLPTPARRVVEKYYRGFRASGAHLSAQAKSEIKDIKARLSLLTEQFGQNLRADERAFALPLVSDQDRQGLSDFYLAKARNAAAERGLPGYTTLGISATDAFLTESARRGLRKFVYKAGKARGANGNDNDNTKIIEEVVSLRGRLAGILGFETFAHFKLASTMAGTPEAVEKMHEEIWRPARQALLREKATIEEIARADGINGPLQPWDWLYYANKIRVRDYAVDENKVREYLTLDQCLEAAFYTANRLFGLRFAERKDIVPCHPDVRIWEVTNEEGRHVALFCGDYFTRRDKRVGAFMDALRDQNPLASGDSTPIVYNVCNFGKPAAGSPALLNLGEYAQTLFHEFGHALHHMLSKVDYPSLTGTKVLRDFVELPSQLFERFALDDAVLTRFARHCQTGEIMPPDMREKIRAAQTFNLGFKTAEFIGSSVLDMAWHSLRPGETRTIAEVEKAVAEKLEMPDVVEPRHKSAHFGHIMRSYAAGYYSYYWAELMDADVFEAFRETGDVFDPDTARRLHAIYAAGDSEHPAVLFRAFRGRDPDANAMLRRRGFIEAPPSRGAPATNSAHPPVALPQ